MLTHQHLPERLLFDCSGVEFHRANISLWSPGTLGTPWSVCLHGSCSSRANKPLLQEPLKTKRRHSYPAKCPLQRLKQGRQTGLTLLFFFAILMVQRLLKNSPRIGSTPDFDKMLIRYVQIQIIGRFYSVKH